VSELTRAAENPRLPGCARTFRGSARLRAHHARPRSRNVQRQRL